MNLCLAIWQTNWVGWLRNTGSCCLAWLFKSRGWEKRTLLIRDLKSSFLIQYVYVSAGTGIAHFVGTNPFKQSYLMDMSTFCDKNKQIPTNGKLWNCIKKTEVRIWHIIWLESKVSENICILKINVNHKSGGKTREAGVTCSRAPSNGQWY